MDFLNVNKEWLNKWSDKNITKDAFITRHEFSNICIKDVGIKPSCCVKNLNINISCKDCWGYVYLAMRKNNLIK